jgi:hypothetical protein
MTGLIAAVAGSRIAWMAGRGHDGRGLFPADGKLPHLSEHAFLAHDFLPPVTIKAISTLSKR